MMNRFYLSLAHLLFCSAAFAATQAPSVSPFHVVIDPGHGGSDAGAVFQSIKESQLSLSYGLKLRDRLKEDPLFKLTMTREKDAHLSLPQRVAIAEESAGELFISLHLNSSKDSRAKGAQFFIQNHMAEEEALQREKNFLAEDLSSILTDLQRMSRKHLSLGYVRFLHDNWFEGQSFRNSQNTAAVKQAPFYVIRKSKMPSVLIEIGFITNQKEAQNLIQPEYQDKIVGFIHDSLTNYRQHLKKGNSPAPEFK